MEAYEFIDVESALVQYIKSVVRVPASTMVPQNKPPEHVLVARVGGTSDEVSDSPMVTFIVSAPGWVAAYDLVKLVRRRVMSVMRLGELPVYRHIEIGGPSRAPDPDTGDPRYQFTVQFKLRGSTAPD
ncbi:hypothetical protein JD276_14065 [Leucobacter sp. CSA1]|uniref:Tail terminator n=1 Tax=Leucobacter chromiisoli TaxID=2796471 RepID=A0A934QBJ9_9MICO|nr:hypothetical protein [Leucobacter chromiisoli]MBK0420159.1 hypothetical protein [Leucobacter chromiisoli]